MPRKSATRGLALIGILVGLVAVLAILAISTPDGQKMTMAARETAAIRSIQIIHLAQTRYFQQFGAFAPTLAHLGPAARGSSRGSGDSKRAGLIPADLAAGRRNGYRFTAARTASGYAIQALPEEFGTSGRRTFYSDQTLVIRNNWTREPATAASPKIEGSGRRPQVEQPPSHRSARGRPGDFPSTHFSAAASKM